MNNHEWWRLLTPLLVHADGWKQIAFNFPAILIVGTLVERVVGFWQLVLVYLISGIVGEIAGLAWEPFGAGASVAGAGLLGALALLLAARNKSFPAVFGAIVILGGATILTIAKDIHGPPILVGALLTALSVKRVASPRPTNYG